MANKLIIVRGIPGSGKSTFAKNMKANLEATGVTVYHYESDTFFMKEGKYCFNPALLGVAHNTCFNNILEACKNGTNYVIVSNTFTMMKELNPYLKLAEDMGYEVEVYRMMGDKRYQCLSKCLDRRDAFASFKNVHECPDEAIRAMVNRFVDYTDNEGNSLETIIYHDKV